MLKMFALRDARPHLNLVPWAGEFVGKYLTSGTLVLRMSEDKELEETLSRVVDRLIELQAENGYLGPWPEDEQLLGHWDLWGHYHVLHGLLLWNEYTGDERALESAKRAADLICDTYLDTDRRIIEAGSPEKNLSIMHPLLILYRKTGNERYLKMTDEILVDLKEGGNFLEAGLKGVEGKTFPLWLRIPG